MGASKEAGDGFLFLLHLLPDIFKSALIRNRIMSLICFYTMVEKHSTVRSGESFFDEFAVDSYSKGVIVRCFNAKPITSLPKMIPICVRSHRFSCFIMEKII